MENDAPWKGTRYEPVDMTPTTRVGRMRDPQPGIAMDCCGDCGASAWVGLLLHHQPWCPRRHGRVPFETGYADRLENKVITFSVAGMLVVIGVSYLFGLFTGWVMSWP